MSHKKGRHRALVYITKYWPILEFFHWHILQEIYNKMTIKDPIIYACHYTYFVKYKYSKVARTVYNMSGLWWAQQTVLQCKDHDRFLSLKWCKIFNNCFSTNFLESVPVKILKSVNISWRYGQEYDVSLLYDSECTAVITDRQNVQSLN